MSSSNGHPSLTKGNRYARGGLTLSPAAEEVLVNQIVSLRTELSRRLFDTRRDIEAECGYPPLGEPIEPEKYRDLFERDSTAARVVEVFPKESWQVQPMVYESEDPEVVTPFEQAWDALNKSLTSEKSHYKQEEGSNVWEYLLRADVLSGIGQYGIIFLGLDDGKDMREPATGPVTGQPSPNGQQPNGLSRNQLRKLTYLRCFSEDLCPVSSLNGDEHSPRFGRPEFYSVTFNDPRDNVQGMAAGMGSATREVHWTRVVHIADTHHQATSNEVFVAPRMRAVLNNILAVRQVYAADGEAFWKNALIQLYFSTHPQLGGDVKINRERFRDDMEKMKNGLQQWMLLMGMGVQSVSPQVVDPTSHIESQLQAICIKLGMPKRIFMGSERGELASSQDDQAWNDRLRFRQWYYITPRIICPFVDRLIVLGVLPAPRSNPDRLASTLAQARKRGLRVNRVGSGVLIYNRYGQPAKWMDGQGGYCVEWPDLTSQSEQEKATVAVSKTQAMSTYVSGGVEQLMAPIDYFTRVLDMDEEEAMTVLENASQAVGEGDTVTVPHEGDVTPHEGDVTPGEGEGGEGSGATGGVPGATAPPPQPGTAPAKPPPAPPALSRRRRGVANRYDDEDEEYNCDDEVKQYNCGGIGGTPGPCPSGKQEESTGPMAGGKPDPVKAAEVAREIAAQVPEVKIHPELADKAAEIAGLAGQAMDKVTGGMASKIAALGARAASTLGQIISTRDLDGTTVEVKAGPLKGLPITSMVASAISAAVSRAVSWVKSKSTDVGTEGSFKATDIAREGKGGKSVKGGGKGTTKSAARVQPANQAEGVELPEDMEKTAKEVQEIYAALLRELGAPETNIPTVEEILKRMTQAPVDGPSQSAPVSTTEANRSPLSSNAGLIVYNEAMRELDKALSLT